MQQLLADPDIQRIFTAPQLPPQQSEDRTRNYQQASHTRHKTMPDLPAERKPAQSPPLQIRNNAISYDDLGGKSRASSVSEYDTNLAFQLFENEVMDATMANFIGIHLLNDLIDVGPVEEFVGLECEQQGFVDPETGAHFQLESIVRKLLTLQKRRAIIDKAIAQTDLELSKQRRSHDLVGKPKFKNHLTDGDELSVS